MPSRLSHNGDDGDGTGIRRRLFYMFRGQYYCRCRCWRHDTSTFFDDARSVSLYASFEYLTDNTYRRFSCCRCLFAILPIYFLIANALSAFSSVFPPALSGRASPKLLFYLPLSFFFRLISVFRHTARRREKFISLFSFLFIREYFASLSYLSDDDALLAYCFSFLPHADFDAVDAALQDALFSSDGLFKRPVFSFAAYDRRCQRFQFAR